MFLSNIKINKGLIGFPNGILYKRDCPTDLRFNQKYGYCDYAENVQC
jgi:hypothetical protein